MSLRNKITSAVNTAFDAVGDLVVSGTLTSKSVTSFDFATGEPVSTSSSKSVDVILTTKKNSNSEGYTTMATLKTQGDLSMYDTLTVGSDIYNIVDHNDNEFVSEMILKKE